MKPMLVVITYHAPVVASVQRMVELALTQCGPGFGIGGRTPAKSDSDILVGVFLGVFLNSKIRKGLFHAG